MPQPTEVQLAEFKAKYPRAQALDFSEHIPDTVVVIRPPSIAEWKRFKEEVRGETTRTIAATNIARACILWPDRAGVDAIERDAPALVDTIGGEVTELGGSFAPTKKAL